MKLISTGTFTTLVSNDELAVINIIKKNGNITLEDLDESQEYHVDALLMRNILKTMNKDDTIYYLLNYQKLDRDRLK